MNTAMRLKAVTRIGTRQCGFCPNHQKPNPLCNENKPSKYFKKLKKNQCRFQSNDGTPIFLKGGFRDQVFYQATWGLILVGMGMTVKLFYDLAKPMR